MKIINPHLLFAITQLRNYVITFQLATRLSPIVHCLLPIVYCLTSTSQAQPFTKADYQHGKLTPARSCFDVNAYEITLKVEPERKYIFGKNDITFTCVKPFDLMQLDLFAVMNIDSIIYQKQPIAFTRDSNAFFIKFGKQFKKGERASLLVYFSGTPLAAKKAPWDGGFVWSKDSTNNSPWVGLACEGLGASSWLPCKDHLSDEAEQMLFHLIVPENLTGVSNGKLFKTKSLGNGFKQFDWIVSYPINNYNITVNVADYAHIHDEYKSPTHGILNLDFYVLKKNEAEAKVHFQQTKRMLECFEKHFGAYPFWNDGYKLVETPYWGMEHQSCVSYGNHYQNNKFGFDFIIIHESGHEWFGNSLSCTDPAEMWIHESFTTYTEAVYMECTNNDLRAQVYLNEQRKNIKNEQPMVGPFDVYYHGRKDNDIYYKGTWILHTMRQMIDNDTLWFNTLRDLCETYKRKNVTTKQINAFFNQRTRRSWDKFFEQYFYQAKLPVFEYKIKSTDDKLELRYRMKADVSGLEMPIRVTLTKDKYEHVIPTGGWQAIDLNYMDPNDFKVQSDKFLIEVRKVE